jgi:hypothetical protein
MKRLTFVLVVLAAASSAAFCVLCAPRVEARRPALRLVTREVSLGRVHAGELKGTRTVSPDRRHVAYVAKVEGGEAVYADGVAGKTYPAIASDPLSEAGTGSPFTYSRDGRRVAYVAHLGTARARGPRRVVVGVVEGPVFDYVWSGGLHFSQDGDHFAYTAERGGKRFAVVDGVEHGPYERVSSPSFRNYKDRGFVVAFDAVRDARQLLVVNGQEFAADDPKGRELFYGEDAARPREVVRGGKHFVVWDGKEVGPFDERIGTSLHTSRREGGWFVAFEGRRGGKEVAVVDGVEGKPYDYVSTIHLSNGGARTLYTARTGEEFVVVVDGKEGTKYRDIEVSYSSPFNADGSRYAYAAARATDPDAREYFVVADGKEGKSYDYVSHVGFTPDGAQLLYLAYDMNRRKTFLVRDGEEVAAYDQMPDHGSFRFSPDGRRMYFRLRKFEGGKEAVVVDGRTFLYDEIKDVEFSPDGRRFVLKGQRGRGWVMVVDGVESELYEADGGPRGDVGWSRDGRLAFSREGGRVAYVGRRGGKEFVVLEGAAGPSYDAVANLDFTPDGRHVAYTARRRGKSLLVVDGVESREYDAFVPAREHERDGSLNVEGSGSLSILARRGSELLRVEVEIVGG